MKRRVLGILLTITLTITSVDFTVFATEQTAEMELTSEEEINSYSREETEKETDLSETECSELSEEELSEVNTNIEEEETITDEKTREEFTTLETKETQIEQEEHTTNEESIVDVISEEITENVLESTTEEIEKNLNSDNSVQSGSYRNITWEIDTNGKLTISGTGDFSNVTESNRAPWYSYRESITSAVVNVTGMRNASYMFYNCENLVRVNLDNFDTSEVTNMGFMFSGCSSLTALDLSNFNTENVTRICWMFSKCSSLTVLDLSSFNTANVMLFSGMFSGCSNLTNLNLSSFNTGNATYMNSMFSGCSSLTALDLSSFNTANATHMGDMFFNCSSLTALDLSNFNTANVTYIRGMFSQCSSLTALDLSSFNTANVTHMGGMFSQCSSLTELDLSNFNTANVTYMGDMFFGCSSLTALDISNFNTANVTDMSWMFSKCSSLTALDISNFNTENVTNMRSMFWNCNSLIRLDISNFNTENVTNMGSMFSDCSNLTDLDVSNFNTKNVVDMVCMFSGCSSLTTLDVSNFNTENVTNMAGMFDNCSCLETVDLSSFDTKNVQYIGGMFDGCSNLITLDISNFDLKNTIMGNNESESIFSDCTMLETIYAPYNLTFTLPLPIINSTEAWYLSDGTVVTELPQNLTYSIVIKKNEIPILNMDNLTCIGGNINGKGYSYGKVRAIHKEEIIKGRKVKWEFQGYAGTFEDKTDEDGYFFLKSPLLSYNENGSNTFELLASVFYFDDNAWINIPDFYTMKVTVEPMSYSQNWQLKSEANFKAGIGLGVEAEVGPAKAEASMAEVSVAASGGGTIDISHDYDGGKRNLSLRQTLSTEVAERIELGPASSLEFANSKAEVTVAGVEGEIAAGGNVTYGITIKDYNPNNMDHLLQVGKFIATSQMYSSGNVLLAQLLTKSGFDQYGMEGAGISSSLSAGASAMGVEVSNADANKTYFSGNLASVNYERTYSVGYENNGYNNTTNKKLGISSDVKGGILNFDFKKDNINELSLLDFGSNMQKNIEFSVIKSSDGKLNKIDYTDKTYTSWGVPFYSNTNSNEISFTTKDPKALQKLENRSNIQKFKDVTNAVFFTETFVNETWKEICECVDRVDYTVTKKEESTIDVPISLGLQAGIKVEIGVDLAGSSEKAYEKYKGIAENDSLRVTAETVYSDADIDNIQIGIGELLSEPISAMSSQLNNWLNETRGNIKEGVQAGTAWVGEKINNAKNWIVHIIYSKQDNSRMASKEVKSFAINTYMPSATRTVESSGVSMTVGEPYIVYVTDENGKEVEDYSENPLVLKLSYNNADLVAAGVTDDSIFALAVYMYSEEKCGYIFMGGDIDTINQEVSIDITKPGQYILAIDNMAPTISNICLSDTSSTPIIKAYINTLSGLSKFSMKIDSIEYVNETTLDKYLDQSSGSFVYKVEKELANGTHTLSFSATDNKGNTTKQPILFDFIVNSKLEDGKTAAPTSNIASGSTVESGTRIKLISSEGAQIYYTLDETTPTVSSILFTEDILITQNTIIKAFAVQEGLQDSDVATFIYNVSTTENPEELGDVLPEDIPESGIPNGLWIAGIKDMEYTGKAIKPSVRVYDYKTKLTEKQDYTISYKNNINVNDATNESKAPSVVIQAKGNYSGKETATFQILAKDINSIDFDIADITVNPNKKVQKPVPAVIFKGKRLSNKKDFAVTYPDTFAGAYKEKGTYSIKIFGKGNYTGERTINFTITDNNLITKANVSKIGSQQYTGKALTPTVQVKYAKTILRQGEDYELAYRDNTEIGTATVIIIGKGDYSGQKAVSFKIIGASISKGKVVGLNTPSTFTGNEITKNFYLVVSVDGNQRTLKEGQDYIVKYQNNKKAGNATLILTGINGYSGTLKKTFKINAYDLQTDANKKIGYSKNLSVAYAKNGSCPDPVIYFDKIKLEKGKDYSLSYKNNKAVNAGGNSDTAPTIIVKGKGNFTGTLPITFAIISQNLSNLTLTANDKAYKNRANIFATSIKITDINGKILSAGKDYDKNGIVYTYVDAVKLENGVSKKAGDDVEKTDIIPADTKIQVSVTAKVGGNYEGTATGIYRIIKSDIKNAKVSIPVQTYTGKAIVPAKSDITVTIGGTRLAESEFEIVSCTNNIKKGKASITIKGKGNYGGTKTIKFTIKSKGFFWWWRR